MQLVLGANMADNVRACICALASHPHVYWVKDVQRGINRLVLTKIQTVAVWERHEEYEPHPLERQSLIRLAEGVDARRCRDGLWYVFRRDVIDTFVQDRVLDAHSLVVALGEVADLYQIKRGRPVPARATLSLARLVLASRDFEPLRPMVLGCEDVQPESASDLVICHYGGVMFWGARDEDVRGHLEEIHGNKWQEAHIDTPPQYLLNPIPTVDTPAGFVYFIGRADGEGLVKIGYSADPARRLGDLQTGSPVELTIIGTVPGSERLEQDLHAQLAANRRHGEWFDRHAALTLLSTLQRKDA